MTSTLDLSTLTWSLRGFTPYQWQWGRSMETGVALVSEIPEIPAPVPGSVQAALRCEGLDGSGWVLVNGREVGTFANAFIAHAFDLTPALRERDNRLQIVFDCPPRWLGQFGYTSRMTEWKPRFNYTWDWTPRLVQIGIWDAITLELGPPAALAAARCQAAGTTLRVWAAGGPCRLTLTDGDGRLVRVGEFTAEAIWENLPVEPWWPNGDGAQPLYTVRCESLVDGSIREWRVGFKSVEWQACEGAPADADPWLCVGNRKPVFLQGVNWTPIRPNFADAASAVDVANSPLGL